MAPRRQSPRRVHFTTAFSGLAIAALASGCGSVRTGAPRAASTGHAPATAAAEIGVHAAPAAAPEGIPSPVYSRAIADVHAACQRACMDYFGHVDQDDKDRHQLVINDWCGWAGGSTVTTIDLREQGAGATLVEIESHGVFPSGFIALGPRERHIINELVTRLDADLARPAAAP